jgi:hypothetical protein
VTELFGVVLFSPLTPTGHAQTAAKLRHNILIHMLRNLHATVESIVERKEQ